LEQQNIACRRSADARSPTTSVRMRHTMMTSAAGTPSRSRIAKMRGSGSRPGPPDSITVTVCDRSSPADPAGAPSASVCVARGAPFCDSLPDPDNLPRRLPSDPTVRRVILGAVPSRLRPGAVDDVNVALGRLRQDRATPGDLRLLTRHFLALLERAHPCKSVEVRVPPYAAIQCVAGARHTRGTPPAVVETDPDTWVRLAVGDLSWKAALAAGRVRASGERSDLSSLLPIHPGR
jgi:uncharacterized SCP-like protein